MKTNKCVDCSKLIKDKSTRCRKCSNIAKLPSIEQRFWSKVNKDGPTQPHMDTSCWEWLGYCNKNYGYGRFSIDGRLGLAHRFSWILQYGELPKDLDILHKCDNPSCVNPSHLLLGTHQDNMQDMVKKGRHRTLKGEHNSWAKLTRLQVDEIRAKSIHTTQAQLGREYGVTQAAIHLIVKGKNWKT